jgi:hypothetical protein
VPKQSETSLKKGRKANGNGADAILEAVLGDDHEQSET